MANTFEGPTDSRQSDECLKVSCFRPVYRALTNEEKALHDEIKAKAVELEALFEKVKVKDSYNYLAIISLEQAVMWIVKALTA